jgi:hypothetical protein
MQSHFGSWTRSGPERLRLAAMVLLAAPAPFLLALGIGEMSEGALSGIQHIPEALVLLLVAAVAWWRPRIAGIVVIAVSSLLFVLWLGWIAPWIVFAGEVNGNDWLLLLWVMGAAIPFVPPFVAGWLLLRSTASRRM